LSSEKRSKEKHISFEWAEKTDNYKPSPVAMSVHKRSIWDQNAIKTYIRMQVSSQHKEPAVRVAKGIPRIP
jgi:hypothetical protein